MDIVMNDLQLAPPGVVLQAARDFAAALAETPEFRAFEAASEQLRQDEVARGAIEAYQAKQKALQALLMLGAVSAEEQAELERLRATFLSQASVQAYGQAETDLRQLCRAAADLISQHIGPDFASACSSGCC